MATRVTEGLTPGLVWPSLRTRMGKTFNWLKSDSWLCFHHENYLPVILNRKPLIDEVESANVVEVANHHFHDEFFSNIGASMYLPISNSMPYVYFEYMNYWKKYQIWVGNILFFVHMEVKIINVSFVFMFLFQDLSHTSHFRRKTNQTVHLTIVLLACPNLMTWTDLVINIPQDRFRMWWSAAIKTNHLGYKVGQIVAMRSGRLITFIRIFYDYFCSLPFSHTSYELRANPSKCAFYTVNECWMLNVECWRYLRKNGSSTGMHYSCNVLCRCFHMYALYLYCTNPQYNYCTNLLHIFLVLY